MALTAIMTATAIVIVTVQPGHGASWEHAIFLEEEDSVVVAVVIVVIPIAVRMPAMFVVIPPSMTGVPAALPRFAQFMTPAFGLLARVAMMLNGFVQLVVRARNAVLAIVVVGV